MLRAGLSVGVQHQFVDVDLPMECLLGIVQVPVAYFVSWEFDWSCFLLHVETNSKDLTFLSSSWGISFSFTG